MRGRPGRGAVIGLAIGVALVGLLILLPSAVQGSFYEITDSLVYLGIPLVVLGAAVGALVGAPGRRAPAETPPPPQRTAPLVVLAGVVVVLVACFLASALFGLFSLT